MRLFDLFEDLVGPQAKRAEFIKTQIGSRLQDVVGADKLDALLEKIAAIDPTPGGSLMPWIARLIAKNPEANKVEDLDRLGQDLLKFGEFKNKIENKDVNSYKSFAAVYDAIAPFLAPRKKTKDELKSDRDAAKIAKYKSEIETVYNGPDGWIRIPHTKGAAQFLGQGTRWCTSAKCNNMYDNYAERDKLFVVYDKKTKERFQLHIESGSFADVADKMQGLDAVPAWARPAIVEWYKKHKENLSFKHVMTLASFGADAKEIAGATEHADLLDLMAQYGV